MRPPRSPILVTGTHYSGTTWVGQVLRHSPRLGYVHEPFNPRSSRPGVCGVRFRNWYTYITEANAAEYVEPLRRTLDFRYGLFRELRSVQSAKDAARMIRDASNFARWRMGRYRPLVKDPIALLSAEWLHASFDMAVVIMIRHPGAFAWSIKRRGDRHPFGDFLRQPLLMSGPFAIHVEQIAVFAAAERDPIDQAGLLWRVLMAHVLICRERHPDWLLVRYEDVADHPERAFAHLCTELGLSLTPSVRRVIARTTSADNPTASSPERLGSHFCRNTSALLHQWKRALSDDEIARLRTWVTPLDSAFYGPSDW